jgi:RNA polymerase sigma-70 factor (ECF subfamily)
MSVTMPQLNHEAFEQVAWPHRPALYRFAMRLARRPDAADDLVQDTFMRAFRAFHTFVPGTNVRAWLFQILRHVFINRYRAERVRRSEVAFESIAENRLQDASPGDPRGSDPESIVMGSILPDDLRRALRELPQPFREAVTYAWIEELSYREIAERLSVPIGTVMSRIHRGRRMLQESLHEFAAARRLVVTEGDGRRLVA